MDLCAVSAERRTCRMGLCARFLGRPLLMLKMLLCLGDVLLGGFHALSANFIQPVGGLVCCRFRTGRNAAGGVFIGRTLHRQNVLLCFILGADVGILYPLGGYRRFIDRFYLQINTDKVL